ncbi:hypothetical protein DA717_09300 [Piscirickettsiaceae bacterium NZ-RLO2]|nr:hypothetical protein DA717_09300 [Piscirickettsiaceae bacterium NZ-RLO2]
MSKNSVVQAYSKACRYIINPDKNNTNDPVIKLAARKTWGRSGKLSQNSINSFVIFYHAYQAALKIYS